MVTIPIEDLPSSDDPLFLLKRMERTLLNMQDSINMLEVQVQDIYDEVTK